jgi:electron transfer flavoprotein alpha subunit
METGPAVAIRLGNTMVTNCTELLVEDDDLSVVRPMFGGTLLAQIRLNKMAPCILSFEKGILPRDPLPSKKALLEKIPFDFGLQTLRTKVKKVIAAVTGDVDITKARILVSVGRGIGSPDKIQIIRDLAEALGGAVACSRPVADMGWLPVAHQVGISANTVAPDVYVACGISGASQHVTAMRDSSTIIAINKDPNAPIFRVADYGIVGDLFDVVPAMIKEAATSK